MSVNKNAVLRYHALDQCFSNPVKKCYIDVLLDACNKALAEADPDSGGIQRRQLYADIKFMESEAGYGIALAKHKDGKKTYYRYTDPGFSINKQPLNQAELEKVKAALHILARFKGMPQFEWVNELLPKMEQTFLLEKDTHTVISFDHNQYLKGIDHLGRLFHAILYKQALWLRYQSFKRSEPKTYPLHPYYLKQYNNRWFIIGLADDTSRLTTFALDRIIDIQDSETAYTPNTTYDFDEYFEDIIGVTRMENTPLQIIKLAFDADIAPYILSKPMHGSQKIVSTNDQELVITLEVIPNYELQTLILSHGERVRVLAPADFQELIRQRLAKAAHGYKEPVAREVH